MVRSSIRLAEKLAQLFDELYLGQIQPENLSQVPDLNPQEAKRLAELAMLYQGFIQEIEGQVLGALSRLAAFGQLP